MSEGSPTPETERAATGSPPPGTTLIPSRLLQAFLWLAIVTTVFYLLVIGQALIIPLVLAFFAWYLVNTLNKLTRSIRVGDWRPPRWLAFTLSAVLVIGVLLGLTTLILDNAAEVQNKVPEYRERVLEIVDRVESGLPVGMSENLEARLEGIEVTAVLGNMATTLVNFAGSFAMVLAYLFFIFLEQRFFESKLRMLIKNDRRRGEVEGIIAEIDRDIRAYIGVKTLVSALTAGLSYVVMKVAGLDFAEFWAVLLFIFNYIPNVGSLIATALPAMLALLQLDLTWFLVVTVGITAVQLLMANLVEPNLMGKSLNQSPLVVILSLVLWGSLWGVAGMFLCVPITVVVMIVLSHFPQTRWVPVALSLDGRVRGDPEVRQAEGVAGRQAADAGRDRRQTPGVGAA